MFAGEFNGMRGINEIVLERRTYDQVTIHFICINIALTILSSYYDNKGL